MYGGYPGAEGGAAPGGSAAVVAGAAVLGAAAAGGVAVAAASADLSSQPAPEPATQDRPFTVPQLQALLRALPPTPLTFAYTTEHMSVLGRCASHEGHSGDSGWVSAPLTMYNGVAAWKIQVSTNRSYWSGCFGALTNPAAEHRSYNEPSFHGWGCLGHGQHYAYLGARDPVYCGSYMESEHVFNRHVQNGDTLIVVLDLAHAYMYAYNVRLHEMKWIKVELDDSQDSEAPWLAHVWMDTKGDKVEVGPVTPLDALTVT